MLRLNVFYKVQKIALYTALAYLNVHAAHADFLENSEKKYLFT